MCTYIKNWLQRSMKMICARIWCTKFHSVNYGKHEIYTTQGISKIPFPRSIFLNQSTKRNCLHSRLLYKLNLMLRMLLTASDASSPLILLCRYRHSSYCRTYNFSSFLSIYSSCLGLSLQPMNALVIWTAIAVNQDFTMCTTDLTGNS